jgi:hypothetical protein
VRSGGDKGEERIERGRGGLEGIEGAGSARTTRTDAATRLEDGARTGNGARKDPVGL